MNIRFLVWTSVALALCSAPLPAADAKAKPPEKPEISIFKDKQLEAAVRKQVFEKRDTDKPVTAEDVAKISTVDAKGLIVGTPSLTSAA